MRPSTSSAPETGSSNSLKGPDTGLDAHVGVGPNLDQQFHFPADEINASSSQSPASSTSTSPQPRGLRQRYKNIPPATSDGQDNRERSMNPTSVPQTPWTPSRTLGDSVMTWNSESPPDRTLGTKDGKAANNEAKDSIEGSNAAESSTSSPAGSDSLSRRPASVQKGIVTLIDPGVGGGTVLSCSTPELPLTLQEGVLPRVG